MMPSPIRHNILLYFIFLFILIGDGIINWSEYKQLSIIPFSLTHICLAIYYILDIQFVKKDFIFLMPVLAFSALLFLYSIYKQEIFIAIIWILYPPALLLLSLMNIQQSKNKYLFLR